jgi:glycosyltransferase involved in cell wall biosynthesis
MFAGNGACVIHETLSSRISDYELIALSPRWQYTPFVLPFLVNQKADVLHTTPDYAIFFRSKCRKLFLTFHNFVLDDEVQKYSSVLQKLHYRTDLKFFTRQALANADVITCVSKATAELVKQTLGYSGDMEIIYNGVDTHRFTQGAGRKNSGEFKILFSGNLTRRKGAHLLVEIARKLKGRAVIYYTKGLNPRRNLPGHTRLRPVGVIEHRDIPRLYQEMDVLLLPSFREGFSVAVLEAMAAALPVVTSDCSSMPEQIEDGKGGYLCQAGDTDAFAESLNMLEQSPAICREMGEFNRERVMSEFTLERMILGYQAVFERLISQGSSE